MIKAVKAKAASEFDANQGMRTNHGGRGSTTGSNNPSQNHEPRCLEDILHRFVIDNTFCPSDGYLRPPRGSSERKTKNNFISETENFG